MRQSSRHGAQAVEQHQEDQDLGLGRKVEHQHALQGSRRLTCLTARTAEAAQPVGALAAGSFRDAERLVSTRAAGRAI
jgi:hypothetical protein